MLRTTSSGRHLHTRTISGIRWGLVSTSADQILRVAFTVLIAAHHRPDDFGVAAQAAMYVGLTGLFIDSGFGASADPEAEIDDDDIGSVFWINVRSARSRWPSRCSSRHRSPTTSTRPS